MKNIPQYHELMIPTIQVIDELGGSGTNQEIAEGVIQFLGLAEEITSQPHNPEKSSQNEVEYRLAWARTYLKKVGLIDNSERGVWSFTEKYQRGMKLDAEEIVQSVRGLSKNSKKKVINEAPEAIPETGDWREVMHQTILALDPNAFERLTKRLLREIGFVQVEVTGKSGDGGIDGKGIVKIQDVLSYHVVFQCKRYKGSVGPGAIRDFRGAMVGRADKGLFITTGTFSREATREATRDGASPIDLIEGDDLVEMLKKLRLGVNVRMVEEVEVDGQWFEKI
ncbi:MAG: restriction endonuclease [Pseudodesulfovibrio sp.]|uniref:Restriction endonuclease n=2 Tax=Desulfovibrionaceae TaxID=194924 RepID=E6VYR0_PSEA9|nr:restriction endonuclease [Pseudodesulfovibrio aespoeensis]ADU63927.1 restriction endonuclease [Pseudodesulfovibrio aespoeensis Aspo-2]MBU4192207.1 restriction endonuclease [Pseudomonadota bacterium]MBV1765476.1 restriction endonuclease [Pseudodesulfovibrio sp.]MBU4243114.1 restriction endonuclease [Pseudomonadota bacterium]MBU4380221.1 restriction endonuclease [Pseudomonadota bacterium]